MILGTVHQRDRAPSRAVHFFRWLCQRQHFDRQWSTRPHPTVAPNKLAYLGVSMGSAEGVIYTTIAQDQLKTVIFLDGGYFLDRPPKGGDQADFAPRLTVSVLMMNGAQDEVFPLDKSQTPFFHMLGSPAADKKHVVPDTPHDVTKRRSELVQAVLARLDKYLGRVD
jgi:eukaryotic-like serine/threonine-protein kinase